MARTLQDIDAARALYTRISSIYDTLSERSERRGRELGLSLLQARPGERILEIGFGTGTSIVALAEAVGESGHVFGIDISPGMKAVAEERIRSAKRAGQISLTLTAIPPIPFHNATFDAIFMALTLVALVILGRLYTATRGGDLLRTLSLALVCGGAVGNLIDRIMSAHGVVDFIDIGLGDSRWPTFNIADMAVSLGAFLLAWVLWGEDADVESVSLAAPATIPAESRELT